MLNRRCNPLPLAGHRRLTIGLLLGLATGLSPGEPVTAPLSQTGVKFLKTVLTSSFVAEGVAVADINRDGRLDVLAGNLWYEAPEGMLSAQHQESEKWIAHEIAPVAKLDPKTQYSNCFHNWSADPNQDGWPDQILIGMPGERAIWRENPGKAQGVWKEHPIWRGAGNESPLYEDLLGDGKRVLIMGYDDNYLAWFEPAPDPHAEWICHNISGLKGAGSQRYSHGLGVGDLNGDGRKDVVTTGGYYLQPANPRTEPWEFVKADLGPDCAHMQTLDADRDARIDVLSSSAHARGIWWHRRLEEGGFARHTIDATLSQTHALNLALLGTSKTPNLITGKRKWAHPPGVDVGSEEESILVRYELRQTPNGPEWSRHVIDEASGVGTQFAVRDMNGDGLLDIVTSNKNGVYVFVQIP